MPRIIPIRDLKNTTHISQMCKESKEPIFVTKNGYGDMVVMSMDVYERTMYMNDLYEKLQAAERSIDSGDVSDGYKASLPNPQMNSALAE